MPTRPPGHPTLDLTTADSFGNIGDAIFETADAQFAGPGNFNTFEQVQNNGFERGYNTDGAKQFDTKSSANSNHSLLLAQVPIVIGDGSNGTQDGVAYREFLLDINEPNGNTKAFLSLDSLQIWQEEAGNLSGFTPGAGFSGAHTNNLVYNLDAGSDAWVGLNAGLSHAHGNSDIAVLIPDSLFINDGTDRFIYLYSAFGAQDGWDAGGSYEEWGTSTPNGPNVHTNAMSISKSASVPGGTADQVGEVVTYSIRVSDVGNTNLTSVTVTDPSVSDMTRGADIVGNNDSILNPGEIWSFTAHHTVTAADLGSEDGLITNTATADSAQTSPVSASASVVVVAPPLGPHTTVTVSPTVADGTADSAGEVINYAISMFNDGSVDLTEAQVQDLVGNPLPAVESGGFNVGDTNQDGVLNIGETWQFTDSYTVTQADLDNRNGGGVPTVDPSLAHTLTVRGLYDQGGPDLGSATTPIVQNPDEMLTKTASVAGGTADAAGEVIHYAISLANDGNMDLTTAMVSDPTVSHLAAVTAGGFNVGDSNSDGELSVGETWQYTADHTVTQAEIDNGGVVNHSLAINNTASATTDQTPTATTASASVAVAQNPSLTLAKAGTFNDANSDGFAEVGETISYTFTETNNGNMTLHSVAVSDSGITVSGSPIGTLAPGAADGATFTGSYSITQADIDAGFKDNSATATSDNATSAPATAHVLLAQNPHVALSETASDANSTPAAGDSLVYTFSLTNGGNVTLHGPTVSDTATTGGVTAVTSGGFNVGDVDHDLLFDPGETWAFTGTRTLTAADITAGMVADTSTASALGPQNQSTNTATANFTFATHA